MKNKAAQELGQKGGKANTEAKANAARTNGSKGGRPSNISLVKKAIRQQADSHHLNKTELYDWANSEAWSVVMHGEGPSFWRAWASLGDDRKSKQAIIREAIA